MSDVIDKLRDDVSAELENYVVVLPEDGYTNEGLQNVYETKRRCLSYLYRVEELLSKINSAKLSAQKVVRLIEDDLNSAVAKVLTNQQPTMLQSKGYAFEERKAFATIAVTDLRKNRGVLIDDLESIQELGRRVEQRYRILLETARSVDGVIQLVRIGHAIGEIS